MRNKALVALAIVGFLLGVSGAWYFGSTHSAQRPAFKPAESPYVSGIYTTGIVESLQGSGENVNIFPEVTGRVTHMWVSEGDEVKAGAPLFDIDSSVQQAAVDSQKATAEAAFSVLEELKNEPRPENLKIAYAQVTLAEQSVQQAREQYEKRLRSVEIDKHSLSADTVDTALGALRIAEANLAAVTRQYELVKAGAWAYQVRSQEKVYQAAQKQYEASEALLRRYTVRATTDGQVIRINVPVGGYVSLGGVYATYTQSTVPTVVLSPGGEPLGVRVFVDEILLQRLPDAAHIVAQMQVRGSEVRVQLEFVRVQPYVTPKIELSDQRTEQIDVRVLPVLFKFKPTKQLRLYAGQQVDVYIGSH